MEPANHQYIILRPKRVAEIFGVSESTVFDWTNPKSPRFVEDFPSRLKFGHNCSGWRSDEIYSYLESCRDGWRHV